jgi:hypothetical protein
MAALSKRRSYTFDAALQLKDAGLVGASAAAQVDGENQIIDLGGQEPFVGMVVIDVSAIETDSSDEEYQVIIEGSNDSGFASGNCCLAAMKMGHATGMGAGLAAQGTGRFELPFINSQNGTSYEYLRAYTKVAGTVATGINYSAFIAPLR